MIIAKSALSREFMLRKMELGADALEIQLLNELVENDDISLAFPNLDECLNIPVYSVHTPLVEYADSSSRLDIILEVLVRSNYIDLFENVCKIANEFGIGRHGQHFTEDSRDYIREVLVCRERYAKDCDIVLEVAETDYSKSLGFDISNKLVREELDSLKR